MSARADIWRAFMLLTWQFMLAGCLQMPLDKAPMYCETLTTRESIRI